MLIVSGLNQMKHVDPKFSPLLEDAIGLDAAENHSGTIFGMWADTRLAYLNPAWFEFARENQGEPAISVRWPIGAPLIDVLPQVVQQFYRDLYDRALKSDGTSPLIARDYECSSPDVYRVFRMMLYPVGNGNGLVVVNALLIEQPHESQGCQVARADDDTDYRHADGLFHQCIECRRMEHISNPARWDWIPELVRAVPPQTSHTLCEICTKRYFGRARVPLPNTAD